MKITRRIDSIKPSPTLALSAKAQELSAKGLDVISLTVGEPDWNTLSVARSAAVDALEQGLTKYTPAGGILKLRKAISEQFKKEFGVEYNVDEITVTAGGKFIIHGVMQALIEAGDEVIIPSPYWVSYPTLVEMAEGTPKIVTCGSASNFKLTGDILERAISKKTRMLVLNSPSNPTGETYTERELKELGEVLRKHPDLLILTDDIYNHLYFESEVAPHLLQIFPEFKNRTIVVNGASKSYSMTGWRLGWAMAPKVLIQNLNKFHTQTVSCANSLAQYAAASAIEKGRDELTSVVKNLRQRMESAYRLLTEIPNVTVSKPTGAFYFWLDIRDCLNKSFEGQVIETSTQFSKLLLEKEMVAVVPGVEFGLEGFLRASFAIQPERMAEAIGRMSRFVAKLK